MNPALIYQDSGAQIDLLIRQDIQVSSARCSFSQHQQEFHNHNISNHNRNIHNNNNNHYGSNYINFHSGPDKKINHTAKSKTSTSRLINLWKPLCSRAMLGREQYHVRELRWPTSNRSMPET
jgi:hypothetical protein